MFVKLYMFAYIRLMYVHNVDVHANIVFVSFIKPEQKTESLLYSHSYPRGLIRAHRTGFT